MSTTVTGKMVMPDGSPIAGAVITAYLNEYGAESNSLEVYPSNVFISTSTDATGLWSLTLWPSSGSVTSTKYTFSIQATTQTVPKEYILDVPNQGSILFSDLLAGMTARDIANELLDTDPAHYDIVIHKGATYYREFFMEDARHEPINLTGYVAKLQAIDSYNSIVLTITDIPVTSDGYIKLSIPYLSTNSLAFSSAKYDLLLGYGDKIYKILEGNITVEDSITNLAPQLI